MRIEWEPRPPKGAARWERLIKRELGDGGWSLIFSRSGSVWALVSICNAYSTAYSINYSADWQTEPHRSRLVERLNSAGLRVQIKDAVPAEVVPFGGAVTQMMMDLPPQKQLEGSDGKTYRLQNAADRPLRYVDESFAWYGGAL